MKTANLPHFSTSGLPRILFAKPNSVAKWIMHLDLHTPWQLFQIGTTEGVLFI